MGEGLEFDRHDDDGQGSKRHLQMSLRNRRGVAEGSAAEVGNCTWRLGNSRHDDGRTIEESKDGRSFLNVAGQLAPLLAGGTAFLLSTALLVIAYTAACCAIVGKDFTESTVGRYVFEQSPYWEQSLREPFDLVLRLCDIVAMGLHLSCSWIGHTIGAGAHALHCAFVDMLPLFYISSLSACMRSPWSVLLLHLAFWGILLFAAFRLVEAGLAFIGGRLNKRVAEQKCDVDSKLDGVRRQQSANCKCWLVVAVQQLQRSFLLVLDVASEEPSRRNTDAKDRLPKGVDRNAAVGSPSYSAGAAPGTLPPEDGDNDLHRAKALEALPLKELSKAPPSEYDTNFVGFVAKLLGSTLPANLMREMFQVIRREASAGKGNDRGSESKDIGPGRQAVENHFLANQTSQQELASMDIPGQPQIGSAPSGRLPISFLPSGGISHEPSSVTDDAAGTAGVGADDADKDWCIVAEERPGTPPKSD